jgi:hypothetical protein
VDSKIRSPGYSDWTLPAELSERRVPYDRPDPGASLIVISVLSLGICGAIWGAVAAMALALLP